MPALSQFYNQSKQWYKDGGTMPYTRARWAVYERQRERFGNALMLRHLPQTASVLNQADARALRDADQERRRLVYRACENERKAA